MIARRRHDRWFCSSCLRGRHRSSGREARVLTQAVHRVDRRRQCRTASFGDLSSDTCIFRQLQWTRSCCTTPPGAIGVQKSVGSAFACVGHAAVTAVRSVAARHRVARYRTVNGSCTAAGGRHAAARMGSSRGCVAIEVSHVERCDPSTKRTSHQRWHDRRDRQPPSGAALGLGRRRLARGPHVDARLHGHRVRRLVLQREPRCRDKRLLHVHVVLRRRGRPPPCALRRHIYAPHGSLHCCQMRAMRRRATRLGRDLEKGQAPPCRAPLFRRAPVDLARGPAGLRQGQVRRAGRDALRRGLASAARPLARHRRRSCCPGRQTGTSSGPYHKKKSFFRRNAIL